MQNTVFLRMFMPAKTVLQHLALGVARSAMSEDAQYGNFRNLARGRRTHGHLKSTHPHSPASQWCFGKTSTEPCRSPLQKLLVSNRLPLNTITSQWIHPRSIRGCCSLPPRTRALRRNRCHRWWERVYSMSGPVQQVQPPLELDQWLQLRS